MSTSQLIQRTRSVFGLVPKFHLGMRECAKFHFAGETADLQFLPHAEPGGEAQLRVNVRSQVNLGTSEEPRHMPCGPGCKQDTRWVRACVG